MADKRMKPIDEEESAAGKKNPAASAKEKKEKPAKQKKQGGGALRWIVRLVILALVAGALAVVGFDAFGLRTKYLNGLLQNIPIVQNLVPAAKPADAYDGLSPEELVAALHNLEAAALDDQETIKSLTEKNDLYIEEITRLQDFEAAQAAFKEEKEAFDRMVAENDPAAYAAFYESMYPETAEALYQAAVAANEDAARVQEYIAAFTAMDGGDAANILQLMIPTDINLVVAITNALDADTRGTILSEMTPENAAVVVKMTAPPEVAAQ